MLLSVFGPHWPLKDVGTEIVLFPAGPLLKHTHSRSGAVNWAQSGVTLESLKGFPDLKAIYGISLFAALIPLWSFGIVSPSSLFSMSIPHC